MASRLLDLPIRPSHPVPAGGVDTGGGSTASVTTGTGGVPAAVADAAGALFFHLGDLAAGDEIAVSRADGSTVRLRVTRVAEHATDASPRLRCTAPCPAPSCG